MNRTLPERIFICGFMGAGKTTIGKALAQQLELPFHDLDEFIVEQAEQSISDIFDNEGEDAFRSKERKALLTIIREQKGVIALGGGTLQNQHIVDHIKVNGLLVFLKSPLDTILTRIMKNRQRPLLLDENGEVKSKEVLKNELQTLFDDRLPFYEQGEVSIDTADFATKDELVNQLVKKIKYHVAIH